MEEGIISGTSFAADMDFDYISELLGDECWLETLQRSDFLNQCLNESQTGAAINVKEIEAVSSVGNFDQPSYLIDKMEPSEDVWIVPRATASPKISVTDRLVRAISYINDSTKDRDVLIQIWGPRDLNGRRVLTTIDQPYIVNSSSTSLASYRSISLNFQFPADKNSDMVEGMPGRVFLGKVPEWTPDVRLFRIDEYARVGYAQTFNVRGTLALPVFDRGSQACVGVIEVVTTALTIKAELDSVCKALQAVDLCSSGSRTTEKMKACSQSYHAALPDILEVMKSACLSHNLPLAQTWMWCVQQGKEGCRHSKENYIHCVSTVDSACYVFDPSVQGFHEACSEHHLLRGQGVAGKAFATNDPCFCDDITSFCKTDYPLSHHARMFGLHAVVAIRFRSVHSALTDFVLEFFLPADCREPEEQKNLLNSLSVVIQKTCKGLRVVTDDELEKDGVISVSASIANDDAIAEVPKWIDKQTTTPQSIVEQSCHIAPAFIQKAKPTEFMYETSTVIQSNSQVSSFEDKTFRGKSFGNMGREGISKRSVAENTISLEVLRRHFAGNLKDASKSLGVCPGTLKRIYRKQGINRWPSRKIQKVRNSLEKLQSDIHSAQGLSGTFQIGSIYSNLPEPVSPSSKSGIAHQFSGSKLSTIPNSLSVHWDVNAARPPDVSVLPASSCSQSLSSSHSCSSGRSWNSTRSEEVATVKESDNDAALKRMRSYAHLNLMAYKDPKPLSRSQSQAPNSKRLPPFPKNTRKESDIRRVKVTYGDEKIRIRMQSNWQFQDLQKEIARRFHIDASGGEMQLKYLDDDSEWVLLTCEADWEECIDVCMSYTSNIIKLSLYAPAYHHGSSSINESRSLI